MRLDRLVAARLGKPAADAFKAYTPTAADRETLGEVALAVLQDFEPLPGACLMMSCVLVQRLAPRLSGPAVVVLGGLQVRGMQVYDPVGVDLTTSNMAWDGHAWAMLGDMVVDISIGRTARLPGAHPALREHVLEVLGPRTGVYGAAWAKAPEDGFRYSPVDVVAPEVVERLAATAEVALPRAGS